MRIRGRVSRVLAAGAIVTVLPLSALAHGLEIEAAWVSAKPTAGADHMAYLTIANEAFHPEYLYKASASVAERVEIHRTSHSSGMKQVQRVEIPFDDRLDMKRSGYHLMLIGVKRPLMAGEKIPITLVFGDNQIQKTTARVAAQ